MDTEKRCSLPEMILSPVIRKTFFFTSFLELKNQNQNAYFDTRLTLTATIHKFAHSMNLAAQNFVCLCVCVVFDCQLQQPGDGQQPKHSFFV